MLNQAEEIADEILVIDAQNRYGKRETSAPTDSIALGGFRAPCFLHEHCVCDHGRAVFQSRQIRLVQSAGDADTRVPAELFVRIAQPMTDPLCSGPPCGYRA